MDFTDVSTSGYLDRFMVDLLNLNETISFDFNRMILKKEWDLLYLLIFFGNNGKSLASLF